ncbi:MAG: hypothetical protein IAF38_02760 [Bacteroidia bacterium]|nr:hypothetical protein [Bacteroidia bacterium]
MKKNILNILLFILSVFPFAGSFAQNNTVNAQAFIKIDTNAIRIGEQAKLEIIFGYDKSKTDKKIMWPEIADTLTGKIDVIGKSRIETFDLKKGSNTLQFRQTITITSFDSGFWVVPPFKFILEGDTVAVAETNPLVLEVRTVPTDTAEASVKDIKPVFDEKWDWKVMLPAIYWTLGGIAILTAAYYINRYLKNRKNKKAIVIDEGPKIPPHITALRELELIKQQKLWTEAKYKEYFTSITDVLRVYIEGRFKIHAMELTTDEILQIFRSQVIDNESKSKLKQILELSDFVKFAKALPLEEECVICLDNAYDFVNGTKREEVVEEKVKEDQQNPEEKKI